MDTYETIKLVIHSTAGSRKDLINKFQTDKDV